MKFARKLNLIILVSLCVYFAAPITIITAQTPITISIDGIDSVNFPELNVIVSVTDDSGYPINNLSRDNFSISEDGIVVTDFEVTPIFEAPLSIVLLIDSSKTMGYGEDPTPVDNTISSAKEFVNSLLPHDRVSVVAFSDDIYFLQNMTDDKSLINLALDQVVPYENTALYDALIEASELLADSQERRVIILFVDGVDSGISDATFDDALGEIRSQDIVVHILGWQAVNQDELSRLSELTNGTLHLMEEGYPDYSAYQAARQSISRTVSDQRGQYQINYTSQLKADAGEHELVIGVNHRSNHAEASRHFIAEPNEVSISMNGYQNDQSIWGEVAFKPEIVAPAPTALFEFMVDGVLVEQISSPPFEIIWDSRQTPGLHTLAFVAEDSSGNRGETTLSLTVLSPITLEITSPVPNEDINEPPEIIVDVEGPSTISKLVLTVDAKIIETIDNPPEQDQYILRWDFSGATEGPHTIKVTAEDDLGFITTDEIPVNVVLGGMGAWVILIVVGVVAAVIIPIAVRSRKKKQAAKSIQNGAAGSQIEGISALSAGQFYLHEIEGMNPGQIWPLTEGVLRLGRKREINDIPLKGLKASREQAVIEFREGIFIVRSLKIENPIYVNNQPVSNERVLEAGDELRAGETVLRVETKSQ